MDSVLTLTDMEARFPGEWILVGEPRTDPTLCVQEGVVLWHSSDRDEVYRKAVELRPKRFAVLYTGTLPEDVAIVL